LQLLLICLHWFVFCVAGGDGDDQLESKSCPLVHTCTPKELSRNSHSVIVERTPNLVRKVTVLKYSPNRQPIPPPRERSLSVKSTKLLTGSYPEFSHVADLSKHTTGSKKFSFKTVSKYSHVLLVV